MTTKELLELAISLISAFLVFGGLMYTGRQLKLTRDIHKQNHDWNRRHAAQQALYHYSIFVPGTELLNKELDFASATEPLPLKRVEEVFQQNPELRITCHKLLNYNEMLAIGVIQGLYDEKVIKQAWRGNMIRSFDSFRYYINDFRSKGRERAFQEQEMIVNRWKNELTDKDFREQTDKDL